MAFTNGTLYGKYDGSTANNGAQDAFTGSNLNNPNKVPALDLFQILAPGGKCLLQVTAAYVVNAGSAVSNASNATIIQTVQMTINQYNSLANPTNPTAAQVMQATFPLNYLNQQLDIFQIEADEHSAPVTHSSFIAGGSAVVWRLLYNGATATS